MRPPLIPSFWVKVVMALTGLVFAAFVLVHMLGNLKVYAGASHFDGYALWLRSMFAPLFPHEGLLWVARVVLLVSLVLHVSGGIVLAVRARRARGDFPRTALRPSSFAARTMLATGLAVLGFLVFHVLDLTLGARPVAHASFDASHPYTNLVASFQRPWVAAMYMVVMLLLAAHLAHGLWASAHDLGVTGPRARRLALRGSVVVALVVTLGNLSIPIAVLLGVIR